VVFVNHVGQGGSVGGTSFRRSHLSLLQGYLPDSPADSTEYLANIRLSAIRSMLPSMTKVISTANTAISSPPALI